MHSALQVLESGLRLDARVVLAWMVEKMVAEGGVYPRAEFELAEHLGMRPHQVRQALSLLRKAELVRREVSTVFDVPGGNVQKPMAIFGLNKEWSE